MLILRKSLLNHACQLKKEEFAKILEHFQETGTIAGMAAIRKPDALRDIYLKGRAHDYDKANRK